MARGLIHTRLHRESGTVSETGRADIAGVAIGEAHPSCDTQTACDLPTQPLLQPSTSGIVMLVCPICNSPTQLRFLGGRFSVLIAGINLH